MKLGKFSSRTKEGRIVVLDDEEVTLDFISFILARKNYDVLKAQKSEEGLELIFKEIPDLVILDLVMPDMDGWSVLQRLRRNPSTSGIPVLVLSAAGSLENMIIAFERGANAFLSKPIETETLESNVERLIRNGGGR